MSTLIKSRLSWRSAKIPEYWEKRDDVISFPLQYVYTVLIGNMSWPEQSLVVNSV